MSIVNIKGFKTLHRFQDRQDMFVGVDEETGEHVLIKSKPYDLSFEAKISTLLSGANGFPKFHYYSIENNNCILVTQLLGKPLSNLFIEQKQTFSLKTIIMIADQVLERLEFLYNKSIVHGRISPEHILIERNPCQNVPSLLYLVNFCHGERFKECLGFNNNILSERKGYGPEEFLSIRALCKEDLSPADDLESLAYMLIYFYNKELPWSNCDNSLDSKVSISVDTLCAGMPKEFAYFLKTVKNLSPGEAPNYQEYRKIFRQLLERSGIAYDGLFDWDMAKPISFNFERASSSSRFEFSNNIHKNYSSPNLISNPHIAEFMNDSTNRKLFIFGDKDHHDTINNKEKKLIATSAKVSNNDSLPLPPQPLAKSLKMAGRIGHSRFRSLSVNNFIPFV
ncbi:Casein kinase I [Tritrichomonas foetus]|uniref:Casein kinase I n=1 Tax=Tritrichomonas foetus TaxID=1144522 RepID=A0A1J4JXB2_9EUKA|nr:Casein kinase I [Tritrichomonas foetus]|eukprot:OHT01917.1 Casein kinase I [Tritrichomonas foetus]